MYIYIYVKHLHIFACIFAQHKWLKTPTIHATTPCTSQLCTDVATHFLPPPGKEEPSKSGDHPQKAWYDGNYGLILGVAMVVQQNHSNRLETWEPSIQNMPKKGMLKTSKNNKNDLQLLRSDIAGPRSPNDLRHFVCKVRGWTWAALATSSWVPFLQWFPNNAFDSLREKCPGFPLWPN